ncbi:MAG: hypothetical protein HQM16_18045 [Deltaproteobacteria bacterium]|nr:hypothetical protein [Deltaproteobacteria bacterium]
MRLKGIAGVNSLYEIVDESGISVFDVDAAKYQIPRAIKRQLKSILIQICQAIEISGALAIIDYVENDFLKKIVKNQRAVKHNMWEVKNPAHGYRLFFIMDDNGNVIVSAVDKRSVDVDAQDKAINRGLNRWEKVKQK